MAIAFAEIFKSGYRRYRAAKRFCVKFITSGHHVEYFLRAGRNAAGDSAAEAVIYAVLGIVGYDNFGIGESADFFFSEA